MASGTIVKVLKLKDEASPQLKKVGGAAKETSDKLDDTTRSSGETSKGFKGLNLKAVALAAGLAAAAKAAITLNQRLADSKNELTDTAVKTGLAAETIGGLRLAAKGSGQELGNLSTGLTQFPKRMADAARETGEALVAFKRLGIEVEDSVTGKMRSADVVLRETLAAISAIPDPTERSALATQAFGKAGTNLMVALSGGELENFISQAREFGVSVGPKAAESAGEWQRATALMGTTFDGTIDKISAAVFGSGGMTTIAQFMTALMAGVAAAVQTVMAQTRRSIDGLLITARNAFSVISAITSGEVPKIQKALGALTGRIGQEVSRVQDIMTGGGAFGVGAFRSAFGSVMSAGVVPGGATPRTPGGGVGGVGGDGGGGTAKKISDADKALQSFLKSVESMGPKRSELEKAMSLVLEIQTAMGSMGTKELPEWKKALAAAQGNVARLTQDIKGQMRESLEGMGADIERASAQLEELGPTLLKTMDDAREAQREAVAGAITAGIQGIQDPTSLLSMAGPGGAAAGAGLGLLQTDPKEIEAKLGGLVDAAKNAGPTLRVILRDLIPAFIAEFPAALVTGLIDALPDIVEAFIIKLPIALAEALIKALKALWDSFVQFILRIIPGKQKGEKGREPGVFRRAGAAIGDLFRTKEGKAEARERRGFATGTAWIDRTGLAMVHQGEAILPASGTISQSVRGRAGGGGQVINVNVNGIMDSNVIDQLGRQLNRHFGTMGRSTLPIFGGG